MGYSYKITKWNFIKTVGTGLWFPSTTDVATFVGDPIWNNVTKEAGMITLVVKNSGGYVERFFPGNVLDPPINAWDVSKPIEPAPQPPAPVINVYQSPPPPVPLQDIIPVNDSMVRYDTGKDTVSPLLDVGTSQIDKLMIQLKGENQQKSEFGIIGIIILVILAIGTFIGLRKKK